MSARDPIQSAQKLYAALTPRYLMVLCVKFEQNWPTGKATMTDADHCHNNFGSGELKVLPLALYISNDHCNLLK